MLCAIDFDNLHTVLRSLYDEMMPLCSDMAGVAQAIAGLGALFYVAVRIWKSLAAAEPVDVFPLLRPFRHRTVYHVLPDNRARHHQFGNAADCSGNGDDARRSDSRYATLP